MSILTSIEDKPACVRLYLTVPGLILLVFSGDRYYTALPAFEFDVAGCVGHKRTADIPLWFLKQVTQNAQYKRLTKCDCLKTERHRS